MIKILLVEDQRLIRQGIEAIIKTDAALEMVGMVDCGEAAIEFIQHTTPDVILLDIHMTKMDGIQTATYIKARYPDIKIILITKYENEEAIVDGLSVGVDGFLLKDMFADNLICSIKNAYRGDVVLSGLVAKILANKIKELTLDKKQRLAKALENHNMQFTDREIDVAYSFMNGLSNKQMAKRLYLSEGTVKNYVSGIYHKINIYNRTKAVDFFKDLIR